MKTGIITLATNNEYAKGAIVLARSLRKCGTSAETICMISAEVSRGTKLALEMAFDRVVEIDIHDSQDEDALAMLGRPELGVTWSKLCAWKFTEYTKMIFMDADMIVLQSIDELFERDELSAVSDCGWPSCFNSGLFVFRPSRKTYEELCNYATNNNSWDGGDQGLLNSYFSDWSTKDIKCILPFGYNVHAAATYAYAPAFKKFQHQIKVIHFLGAVKPWQSMSPTPGPFSEYWQLWWSIYKSGGGVDRKFEGSTQMSEKGVSGGRANFQSVPSVGSIDDILTHIDSQLTVEATLPPKK